MSDPDSAISSGPVEFAAFELSKENIQPNRGGRSAKAIVEAVKRSEQIEQNGNQANSKQATATNSSLDVRRSELELAIKNYSGDCPLSPWLNYIQWTQQTYLNSTDTKSYLLPLLEKCVRKFQTCTDLLQNRNYVQVWLLYAAQVEDPTDLYQYMYIHHIGTQWSFFYEHWANFVSTCQHNYERAQEILQFGLAMQAKPVGNIKSAIARINKLQQNRLNQLPAEIVQQAMFSFSQGNTSHERRALTARPLTDSSATVTTETALANPSTHLSKRMNTGSTTVSSTSSSCTNFQVFSDASSASSRSTSVNSSLPQFSSLLDASQQAAADRGHWNELSSRATVNKENQGMISTWNAPLGVNPVTVNQNNSTNLTLVPVVTGPQYAWSTNSVSTLPSTQPSNSTTSSSSASSIEIFVEPELETAHTLKLQHSAELAAAAHQQLVQATQVRKQLHSKTKLNDISSSAAQSSTAKLNQNPLRNIQKTEKKPSQLNSEEEKGKQPTNGQFISANIKPVISSNASVSSNAATPANVNISSSTTNPSSGNAAASTKLSLKEKLAQRHARPVATSTSSLSSSSSAASTVAITSNIRSSSNISNNNPSSILSNSHSRVSNVRAASSTTTAKTATGGNGFTVFSDF